MNHLSLVALIAACATLGVASAEEKCTKKRGDVCDSATDKPCFTTQSLSGVEYWLHLQCKGVMKIASWACKSVPAKHKLEKMDGRAFVDVKCSDDIKAADTIGTSDYVSLRIDKSIMCSPTEGIREL